MRKSNKKIFLIGSLMLFCIKCYSQNEEFSFLKNVVDTISFYKMSKYENNKLIESTIKYDEGSDIITKTLNSSGKEIDRRIDRKNKDGLIILTKDQSEDIFNESLVRIRSFKYDSLKRVKAITAYKLGLDDSTTSDENLVSHTDFYYYGDTLKIIQMIVEECFCYGDTSTNVLKTVDDSLEYYYSSMEDYRNNDFFLKKYFSKKNGLLKNIFYKDFHRNYIAQFTYESNDLISVNETVKWASKGDVYHFEWKIFYNDNTIVADLFDLNTENPEIIEKYKVLKKDNSTEIEYTINKIDYKLVFLR